MGEHKIHIFILFIRKFSLKSFEENIGIIEKTFQKGKQNLFSNIKIRNFDVEKFSYERWREWHANFIKLIDFINSHGIAYKYGLEVRQIQL